MFGLGGGKDKPLSRVGAREKMKMARAIAGGAPAGGDKDAKRTPPGIAVFAIYIMSTALAYILTAAYIEQGGLRLSLGDPDLDRLLFKPGTHNFFGSPDLDYVFLIALRGFAIFLAAGIWPFTTLVVQRALDNAHLNIYRAFWGTPIGLTLFFVIVKEYFWPALSEILKLAS